MAASKSHPPQAPRDKAAPAAATPVKKIRAGMGDVEAETVEVWSDDDYRRATGLLSILREDGSADSDALPALDAVALRDIYRGMVRIRIIDDRLMTMQRQGRIGFYAEARGQEAAVIGSVAALVPDDFVVPAHRELGAVLFRGLPLRSFVAQLLGNANDIAKGRQMPVHPGAPRALNYLPPSSCVATQLPQATGIAWAAKILKKKTVVLGYLGEGGTSAEDFHAGVNFAAVFRTPVVFLCQNNQWAISTPAASHPACASMATTCSRCTRPPARRWIAPAAATARR